jgi:ABC-type enterochelin transport system substrate-binding protein
MLHKIFLALSLAILFTACSNNSQAEQQLAEAQAQMQKAEVALAEAQAQLVAQQSAKLIHIVMLNIKDDLSEEDLQTLATNIKRIGTIGLVHNFEFGTFADVGDKRALSDYEMVMKMAFTSREEMAKYQVNEVHEEVRTKLGPYLAAPPAVYDYEIF